MKQTNLLSWLDTDATLPVCRNKWCVVSMCPVAEDTPFDPRLMWCSLGSSIVKHITVFGIDKHLMEWYFGAIWIPFFFLFLCPFSYSQIYLWHVVSYFLFYFINMVCQYEHLQCSESPMLACFPPYPLTGPLPCTLPLGITNIFQIRLVFFLFQCWNQVFP